MQRLASTVNQNIPTKAVTLRQPWATFVAMGLKRYICLPAISGLENYFGAIAIHSSKKPLDYWGHAALAQVRGWGYEIADDLPLGVSVGLADVIQRHTVTPDFKSRLDATQRVLTRASLGGIVLEVCGGVEAPPIALRGQPGLWDLPEGASAYLGSVLSGEVKDWIDTPLEVNGQRLEYCDSQLELF